MSWWTPRRRPPQLPLVLLGGHSLLAAATVWPQLRAAARLLASHSCAAVLPPHPPKCDAGTSSGSASDESNQLISMYGKRGDAARAQAVFDAMPARTVVSWTALAAAYVRAGHPDAAVRVYHRMTTPEAQRDGVRPNARTLATALRACAMLAAGDPGAALRAGQECHAEARRAGVDRADAFVGSALVCMYGKCGRVPDARAVLDGFLASEAAPAAPAAAGAVVAVWNAMLAVYVQSGMPEHAVAAYQEMTAAAGRRGGVSPDERTFVAALQACGMLGEEEGEEEEEMGEVDHHHRGRSSNGSRKRLEWGMAVHARAEEKGCVAGNVFVATTLVSMYAKSGCMARAREVFDAMPRRSVVSWNAVMAGYVRHGEAAQAVEVYDRMMATTSVRRGKGGGVSPDAATFVTALQACAMLASRASDDDDDEDGGCFRAGDTRSRRCCLDKGRAIHGHLLQRSKQAAAGDCNRDQVVNQEHDDRVSAALIGMYGSCGSAGDAERVYQDHLRRHSGGGGATCASRNAMVVAYAHLGLPNQAVHLYCTHLEEEDPEQEEQETSVVATRLLQACGAAGRVDLVRQVHRAAALTASAAAVASIWSALVDAYAKCGAMADARRALAQLHQSAAADTVAWTALAAGYARHGDAAAALRTLGAMRRAGAPPDAVTFLALLTACAHAGAVDAGLACLGAMAEQHRLLPRSPHWACVVDMLARAGCLAQLDRVLDAVQAAAGGGGVAPLPPDVWVAVLAACRKHAAGGDPAAVAVGERAFGEVVRADPCNAGAYLALWQVYAQAGMWGRADEVAGARRRAGAWKRERGETWLVAEGGQGVRRFVAGGEVKLKGELRGQQQQEEEDEVLAMLAKCCIDISSCGCGVGSQV